MVKVRGRASRASIKPRPESSESSYVSESENDSFLTARNMSTMTSKSAMQTFMSAEGTFSADATVQNNPDEDNTLLDNDDAVIPLGNVESAVNSRVLRSAAKKRRQSRSVMNLNKTPKESVQASVRFKRNAKRRRSAPGLVSKVENTKRKISEGTDDLERKMLESTPTDHAAAKRKFTGSEPTRKQMLLNLSPIETMPSQQRAKAKGNSPTSSTKIDVKSVEVPKAPSSNDTITLSSKPNETTRPVSAKKDIKSTASSSGSKPVVSASHGNIATSVAAFRSRGVASPRGPPVQKMARNEAVRKLTIPNSPKFATSARTHSKPIDYEPMEERERKLADEMKKYRFKAQPVPKNVTKAATIGSVQVKPEPPKQPVKMASIPKPKPTSAAPPPFNCQPNAVSKVTFRKEVDKKKPLGITGGGGIQKKRATDARTPTFKLSDRIRQKNDMKKMMEEANRARQAAKEQEEKAKHEKFMKAALKGVPSKVSSSAVASGPVEKVTKPAPFSFYEIDQQRKALKDRKIQEVYEEEKRQREFRAHPLPNLHAVTGLPPKDPKPATRPEPFSLATDDRNAAAHTTWSTTVESDVLETEEQYTFRARPMPDLSIPFIPEKSQREPTEPLPIVLHTAVRAEERKPFDEYVKAREEELEEVKRQREIEKEEEERREALKLRKSMVHHAQPVRHYKPTIIEHHRIPPTVPESPFFATRTRAQARAVARAVAAALEEQDEALNQSTDTYVVEEDQ